MLLKWWDCRCICTLNVLFMSFRPSRALIDSNCALNWIIFALNPCFSLQAMSGNSLAERAFANWLKAVIVALCVCVCRCMCFFRWIVGARFPCSIDRNEMLKVGSSLTRHIVWDYSIAFQYGDFADALKCLGGYISFPCKRREQIIFVNWLAHEQPFAICDILMHFLIITLTILIRILIKYLIKFIGEKNLQ